MLEAVHEETVEETTRLLARRAAELADQLQEGTGQKDRADVLRELAKQVADLAMLCRMRSEHRQVIATTAHLVRRDVASALASGGDPRTPVRIALRLVDHLATALIPRARAEEKSDEVDDRLELARQLMEKNARIESLEVSLRSQVHALKVLEARLAKRVYEAPKLTDVTNDIRLRSGIAVYETIRGAFEAINPEDLAKKLEALVAERDEASARVVRLRSATARAREILKAEHPDRTRFSREYLLGSVCDADACLREAMETTRT